MPEVVACEGYDASTLQRAYENAQAGLPVLSFTKKPSTVFYKELHHFIKYWSYTRHATKTAIGRLYLAIDPYLRQKGLRPDNAYQFVESKITQDSSTITYRTNQTTVESGGAHQEKNFKTESSATAESYAEQIETEMELYEKKQSQEETLDDIIHKMETMQTKYEKQLSLVKKQNAALLTELMKCEDELQKFMLDKTEHDENDEELFAEETEMKTQQANMIINTKNGNSYSVAVRKLYYNLLASNIPPAKIHAAIKDVLRHLVPSVDITKIALPKASTANYMRKEELKTVGDVHKATELCKTGRIHLNTDGTTLGQRKIAAACANELVFSVNEVPNGSAEEVAKNISKELERLRKIAQEIGLENANSINWSLVVSSTSDCAATQKKFNRVAQMRKNEDLQKFGYTSVDTGTEIISNFCAMHLGINLRHAFLQGSEIADQSTCTAARQYYETDIAVHEFCKLFGTKGVNECGVGVLSFPDFLDVEIQSGSKEKTEYYVQCQHVHLARQVGSRYFVSAHNAARIVFLRGAALDYLQKFKIKKNKLENDVFLKLQDPSTITNLKADGLMFLHVYADLTNLAKSTELKKCAMDMNMHYLELDGFLEHVEDNPSIVLKNLVEVFKSEPKLYGDEKTNHRIGVEDKIVYSHLQMEEADSDLQEMLLKKVANGAKYMRKKLKSYAKEQLPGGKYWDPPSKVAKVLKEIQPSNDICESILGLNDWLQTIMPSVSQLTKSNLIEVKKNKTLQWLESEPAKKQEATIKMALRKRKEVRITERKHIVDIQNARQSAMSRGIQKQQKKDETIANVKKDMTQMLIINSIEQLDRIFKAIDNDTLLKTAQKTDKKKKVMKAQVNLRKVLLQQPIILFFSNRGKPIPLAELVGKFKSIIINNPLEVEQQALRSLVGKKIEHRFFVKERKEVVWFKGTVLEYDEINDIYEVQYDNEDELCHFALEMDYAVGDLRVIDS